MARIIFVALLALLAVTSSLIDAAPLKSRQAGDLQCNIARVEVISDVAQASKLLSQINSTDSATASAVSTAQAGLTSAGEGIKTILTALIAGQTASADARNQTGSGLLTAFTVLSGLNSTDPSIMNVLDTLEEANSASNTVVDDCK